MNLVSETNLVRDLFLLYFANFIYNLYMFRTCPGPSSGGTNVFIRHLVLVILYSWLSGMQDLGWNPAYQTVRTRLYTLLWRYSVSTSFGRNHFLLVPYSQIF